RPCTPLTFSYYTLAHPRFLSSFPTRRSSDLQAPRRPVRSPERSVSIPRRGRRVGERFRVARRPHLCHPRHPGSPDFRSGASRGRSEEHTSELQSLTNIVCRLLLDKKQRRLDL